MLLPHTPTGLAGARVEAGGAQMVLRRSTPEASRLGKRPKVRR